MLLRQSQSSQSKAAERPGRLSGQNRHVGVGLIGISGDMHEDLKAYGFATTLNRKAGPSVVHLSIHVEFHAEVLPGHFLPIPVEEVATGSRRSVVNLVDPGEQHLVGIHGTKILARSDLISRLQ